jgi:hypothetical protein
MTFHQGYSVSSLDIKDTHFAAYSCRNAIPGKSDSTNKILNSDYPNKLLCMTAPNADSFVIAS